MSAFTGRVCFAAVRSVFSDKKKLFIAALSQTLPEGLSEPTRPGRAARALRSHHLFAGTATSALAHCRAHFGISAQPRRGASHHLSTPEQKCIGLPEQKYINDAGKKAPNAGAFSSGSGLVGMIRRRIRAGTA